MHFFFNKKYGRENQWKNIKGSVTCDENGVYQRYLFLPLIERGPSFSVAHFTAATTIDHNERIVTWINSLRGPENVFSRQDYRCARERGSIIIRRRMKWAQHGANISGGGGVYPRMTSSARHSSRFYSLSVYFKIARTRLPGLLRSARDTRGTRGKILSAAFIKREGWKARAGTRVMKATHCVLWNGFEEKKFSRRNSRKESGHT